MYGGEFVGGGGLLTVSASGKERVACARFRRLVLHICVGQLAIASVPFSRSSADT